MFKGMRHAYRFYFHLFLFCSFLVFILSNLIYSQDAKPIFDGRLSLKPSALNAAEQKLWFEKILPAAENYWKDSDELLKANNAYEPIPRDITSGSFTKKGAKQKAILYNFKNTGHNYFINGIVILDNNKIIAHIVYNGGPDNAIGALPDINKNGLSEIVIAGSGQNTGEMWKSISIIEVSKSSVSKLGRTTVYTDNFGTRDRKGKAEAFKLYVKAAKTPVFFKEPFISKDINGAKNSWNRVEAMKQIKLDDDNNEYEFMK